MRAPQRSVQVLLSTLPLLLSLQLVSCVAAEAVAPQVAPPPKAAEPPPRVEIAPDTPLELPEDLLLVGRWRDPAGLLQKLGPSATGDLSIELALRERIGQPHHPVDLNQPIELLAVLDRRISPPELAWALSLGLVDAAAPALTHGPVDVPSPLGFRCAEARALGSAPLRLVCAGADEHLARLLAAATRAVPLAPLGAAEVSFSMRSEPLRAVDDRALHSLVSAWLSGTLGVPSMNERFDAQFSGVISALVRELRDVGEDLDAAALELSLQPHPGGVEISIEALAAPPRSALAQLILGSGASGLAPADFWYAHSTSAEAGFIWTFESALLERWRAPLAELLSTALDFRGVPLRLGRQARHLVESLPVPRGPIVHASGPLPPREKGRSPGEGALERLGWQLLVVRGSFSEYQYYVSELVKAFNDPILGPQFGRFLRAALGPVAAPLRLKQRRPQQATRLPQNSFTLEIEFPSAPGDATPGSDEREADGARGTDGSTLFVLMSPDEDGVKIAWGADEKFLASLLTDPAKMKATATLASRAGLGVLHERRTLAAGFYSLAALGERDSRIRELIGLSLSSFEAAPHRGLSPIVYSLNRAKDDAPLAFTANVGRETLEDLLFWIAAASRPRAPAQEGP